MLLQQTSQQALEMLVVAAAGLTSQQALEMLVVAAAVAAAAAAGLHGLGWERLQAYWENKCPNINLLIYNIKKYQNTMTTGKHVKGVVLKSTNSQVPWAYLEQ
jgi:hypothetical protein